MRSGRWGTHVLALVLLFIAGGAGAQSVKVAVSEVTDDRVASDLLTGALRIQLELSGPGLEKAVAARAIVKEAKDDRGTNLAKDPKPPDFMDRNMNSGALDVSLDSPARDATSVSVKGNVELFVPSKDPAATITVPKAFAKLDKPISSPALTTAGIKLTPMSAQGYAEMRKKQKLTEKDIEEIRAQGKAHGASDKEIEFAIGLAKAFDEMDTPPPEGSVILSGSKKDFDKIHSVEILGADKKPIDIRSRESSSRGDSAVMTLKPDSLPDGASLKLTLLTAKSRLSVPFELKKVDLP